MYITAYPNILVKLQNTSNIYFIFKKINLRKFLGKNKNSLDTNRSCKIEWLGQDYSLDGSRFITNSNNMDYQDSLHYFTKNHLANRNLNHYHAQKILPKILKKL